MRAIFLALIFSFQVGCLVAGDYVIVRAENNYQGKVYHSTLMRSHLDESAKWDSDKTPPPLSPKKAGNAGKLAAEKRLGLYPALGALNTSDGWEVWETALINIYASNLWYYKVTVRRIGSGGAILVTLFVTMDGKAVPLEEVGEKRKP